MPRLPRLGPILPLILTTISFAFIIVSLTSPSWSIQKAYDPSLDMTDWVKPLYTRQRSPFQICDGSKKQTTASTNNSTDSSTTTTYTVSCQKFDAFGTGKTSCETVAAIKSYDQARAGDERLCQQIHKSGNLVISATTFITLGFTLTLLLTLFAIAPIGSSSAPPNADGTTGDSAPHSHKKKSRFTIPFLNLIIISSLSVGGVTALLSQFYAILAFVQSQPPNGAWATGRGNVIDPTQDNASGPWIEGVVIKAYLTIAWVFASAGAIAAGSVWRLPRFEKL